jgi:uncharacterized membrane protein
MKKFTVIIILAIIATINAAYLSCKARWVFWDGKAFCDISSKWSCANVVNHPAAYIWPIPFPATALLVYPIIIILAGLWLRSKNAKKQYEILTYLSWAGILYNGYFIMQEIFVIKAFCPLCLLCTWIIITIFVLSLIGWKKGKSNQ